MKLPRYEIFMLRANVLSLLFSIGTPGFTDTIERRIDQAVVCVCTTCPTVLSVACRYDSHDVLCRNPPLNHIAVQFNSPFNGSEHVIKVFINDSVYKMAYVDDKVCSDYRRR